MKEKPKNPRLKSFSIIIGLTMIVVVIIFCLYYLFFVTSQSTYFTKRNFRVLSDIGDHISSKIEGLATNLENLAKKADEKEKTKVEGKDKFTLPAINPAPITETGKTNPLADAKKVKESASLVLDFDEFLYRTVPTPRSDKCNTNAVSPSATPAGQPPAAAASSAADPQPVNLSVKPEKSSFWLFLEQRIASCPSTEIFSAKSDLNTLFETFVSRYVIDEQDEAKERLFDEVLVAEETGRVIFERGSAGLSVVTLNSLVKDKGGQLELKLTDQPSHLEDVRFAGAEYKLFLQPVTLTRPVSTDENKQGVRWVVCGLTRTDHFRDETFAVSYTVLITFVFVVLLAALSWPLLKLKLMGPKERLRRVDFGLTMFSALMGTALVTFILLHLDTHLSLSDALDENIKTLSATIKTNFKEELGRALDQLRKLNEGIAPEKPAENVATGSVSLEGNAPEAKATDSSALSFFWRPDILTGYLDWRKAPYPYFNNATWTDPKGQQRVKWTTRSDTTTFVNVSKRQFFKDAQENKNTWTLKDGDKPLEYSLQLINSKTTGENIAIIATPVPGSSWVSNLDTKLISLMGTVLPVGYGYAVIDSSGGVVFHSDEVKNLEEQFFAECENDRWLRAAVLARINRPIDTNYLGKGHRMYVSPLEGTPWTLVTFVDKRIARTINLEVVTLSFVLYFLFALLILALIAIVFLSRMIPVFSGRYLRTQDDGIRWLWPDPKRARHYGLLIMSYALIACIFVLALKVTSGCLFVICCVGIPVLAAFLWWLILIRDPSPQIVEAAITRLSGVNVIITFFTGRWSYRTRYAIAFAGLLLLVSVLPATGFFKIAHNFEMRLMVKHGQVSLAKALDERTKRVDLQYASIKVGYQGEQAPDDSQRQAALRRSKNKRTRFLDQRREQPSSERRLDVYDSCFFGTTSRDLSRAGHAETPGPLDCLLLEVRPLYNQTCIESQGLSAGASSDKLWGWERDPGGHILLRKAKDGRDGEPSVALMSNIPTMVAPNTIWGWLRVVASIALVVLLPYGLVRFVARRFFLLDMDLPECIDFESAKKLTGSRVVVWSPMTANGHEWAGKKYYDLNLVTYWPAWTEKLMSDAPKAGPPVVLDNFEHCMDDPVANREKLVAIEYLQRFGREVVVVSTVDPLSFSSKPPKPATQAAAKDGEQKTAPSESISIDGKQTGAADLKIESHGSIPFSVSIEGKEGGADEAKREAPVFNLPQDLHARWMAAFTSLLPVFAADRQTAAPHPGFVDILKTKAPWGHIDAIGNVVGQHQKLPDTNCRDRAAIEEFISQVAEQARPYHQSLWDSCSEGQRCTLIQLAQDGMISPKNKHLRQLLKRGLVVRDPGLRLMDESFRRFVKSVSREQDLEGWRQQEGGSAWQLLRAPLLLILVGVALFLFITQKDVYDSSISFLSAVTGGIAALFRLLGMFHSNKGGGAIPS